jgi:hypothetical protein
MTNYRRLMRRAQRRNLIRADAEMIGWILAKLPEDWHSGLRAVLFGWDESTVPAHGRRGVLEQLSDALHQQDWNLVAEALDTIQTLRRSYARENWKRLRNMPLQSEPPPKYVQ